MVATTSLIARLRRLLLPEKARKLLLMTLANRLDSFAAASMFAKRAGIDGFVVDGACGRIRGAVEDKALIKAYAEKRTWSPNERLRARSESC